MSKVKIKQVKQTLGDGKSASDINELFEEMLGIKDCDVEIILPKIVTVRNTIRKIHKVLVQFSTFTPIQTDFPKCIESMKEINDYAEQLKTSLELGEEDVNANNYSSLTKEEVNIMYKKNERT